MEHYIAVDIGASSGRLMLGYIDNAGKLALEECHRFDNGFTYVNGHDRWDIDRLLKNILIGLEKVKARGISQVSLGIDTWAVDYVLVNDMGHKLADPISYRDKRTEGVMTNFTSDLFKEDIYSKTGIQFLSFNTLYQLVVEDREMLDNTDKILMIPDYLNFKLTGRQVTEVTNASTTQLLNIQTQSFDKDLLEKLEISEDKWAPLTEPGTSLGPMLDKWHKDYNLPEVNVVTVASHDTASAVIGTPVEGHTQNEMSANNWAYLSSGTWSLLGIETQTPNTSSSAFQHNFTNEWGAFKTYRFLKNIMGLWMVQEVRRLTENKLSFAEMAEEADRTPYFTSIVDVSDDRFTHPENMIEEIKLACKENNQPIPETIGEITNCIYSSLVVGYSKELKIIEELTGEQIKELYIVGGGSNVKKVNQLTADYTGKRVYAGPSEATSIGNLIIQLIANGKMKDLFKARQLISDSFLIEQYKPVKGD
jgi:rhamnulokinase